LIENGIPNITVENDKIYAHEKLTLLKKHLMGALRMVYIHHARLVHNITDILYFLYEEAQESLHIIAVQSKHSY